MVRNPHKVSIHHIGISHIIEHIGEINDVSLENRLEDVVIDGIYSLQSASNSRRYPEVERDILNQLRKIGLNGATQKNDKIVLLSAIHIGGIGRISAQNQLDDANISIRSLEELAMAATDQGMPADIIGRCKNYIGWILLDQAKYAESIKYFDESMNIESSSDGKRLAIDNKPEIDGRLAFHPCYCGKRIQNRAGDGAFSSALIEEHRKTCPYYQLAAKIIGKEPL